MHRIDKLKIAALRIDAPASEALCRSINVLVDVQQRMAVGVFGCRMQILTVRPDNRGNPQIVLSPQRVELEELARIVLVRTCAGVGHIVQVVQHRCALRHRPQHLSEIAEQIPAHNIPVVMHPRARTPRIPAIDVEMVVPKVCQNFDQLPLAVDCTQKSRPQGLGNRLHALLPGDAFFDHMLLPKLLSALAECAKALGGQQRITCTVVDRLWIQLLVDIDLQPRSAVAAQRIQCLQVSRTRAKPHPVERNDFRGRKVDLLPHGSARSVPMHCTLGSRLSRTRFHCPWQL